MRYPYQEQMTSNIGVYHVCRKLSELGWNANPIEERRMNARNLIRCENEAHVRSLAPEYPRRVIFVQVKSLSGQGNAVGAAAPDRITGDYWVIVRNVASGTPECYILLTDEIKENITIETNRQGKISYFFDFRVGQSRSSRYDIEPFKEAWEWIGSGFANR